MELDNSTHPSSLRVGEGVETVEHRYLIKLMQNLSSSHIQELSSWRHRCIRREAHKEGMKALYRDSYRHSKCVFSIWCPRSCILYTKTVILHIPHPRTLSLYYIIKPFMGRIT